MAKNESVTVFTSEYATGVINNAQLLISDPSIALTPTQRELFASRLTELLTGIYRREYDQTLILELAKAIRTKDVAILTSLLEK